MKLYQSVWLTSVTALGAVCTVYAVLVFPIAVVIAVALGSALVAAFASAVNNADSTPRQLGVKCSRLALNGAGTGVATLGMVQASGWSGFLLVLLLAAASPYSVRWVARRLDPSTSRAELSEGPRPGGVHRLARVSPALMSAHQLGFAWRLSWLQIEFTTSPGELLQLVQHRSALLDEMYQRDPEGFSRWLTAAPHPFSDPPLGLP
jgi:hypothetical protein